MEKRKRVFISFDYDNDLGVKEMLVGQAKNSNSPFDFKDASVKEHLDGDWKEKVRRRMENVDVVLVLCGEKTNKARGVEAELEIAKACSKPYFFLAAYKNKTCVLPEGAWWWQTIHEWTWPNLVKQIG